MKTILRLLGVLALSGLLLNLSAWAQTISSPVTLLPASATANVSTTVLATVRITDPLVIPSSVNLVRIDASGRSTVVGTMHDDGLIGDISSNDLTYTLRVTVLEALPRTLSYKASAVFRGRLTRVQSSATGFIVTASSPAKVVAITTGESHTCALTETAGIKCWGRNTSGQIGTGNFISPQLSPTSVVGLSSGVASITAGIDTTCALTIGGAVKCWGYNGFGELGNGTSTIRDGVIMDRATPQDVIGLSNGVSGLNVAAHTACALTSLASVKCWGVNDGQMGVPVTLENVNSPTPQNAFSSLFTVGAVSSNCVLTNTGGIK